MFRNKLQFFSIQSKKTFSNWNKQMSNCTFCKIISQEVAGEILYQDDDVIIFKDIKPAAKFHFLSVPREHIVNVNHLTNDHSELLKKLIECGKKVLQETGGDVRDVRLGFHKPPFNSVSHLHLHIISPASSMSMIGNMVFKPNTWWFNSADQVLEKVSNKL